MTTAMTSREIMKRAIHFNDPPRVGMYFGRFGWDDTVDAFEWFIKDEHGTDPWGTTFVVHPDFPSIGIPREHPIQTPDDVDKIKVPSVREFAARTVTSVRALTPEQQKKYRFIATSSGIWERIQYFRGMESIMEDLILNPELVDRLLGTCVDFWVDYIKALAPIRGEIDAIYMFDDWGTQLGPMIGPAMWQRFFAKHYRRITDTAHELGMDFWLHSCGCVTDLIPSFIEVGMDLINPYQSGTCGYERVARDFAGKVAFLTTVDTQSTLTHGTPEQVLAECRRLEKWGTEHGGFVIGGYSYDTPEANERVVFDYFRKGLLPPTV